jgi:acyl-CoA thioesterase I
MSETIVFIGDSITDCDRRTDPLGLGGGYVDMIARALRHRGDTSTIVNTGISGDRVEHLQARWQQDALDHRPTVLSIYIGVNDTLVAFFQGRPTPPELFEQRYVDILERTAAAGMPKLVIVDPFYVPATQDKAPWFEGNAFAREDLDSKRPIVRALATRYGAAFVPLQDVMDAAVAERGPAVIAPDGVHPSSHGDRLIARRWLEAYDTLAAPVG